METSRSKYQESNASVDSSDDEELDDSSVAEEEVIKYLNKVSCQKDVLFFVLQEKYEENEISFTSLRGKDKDLAHLLQNCHFLDVHLAMVKCNFFHYSSSNVNELKSAEASRWVDSNDVVRNLNLKKLNWKNQRVGSNRNFLATYRQLRENSQTTKNYGFVMRQNDFYHCILVIWPKHQSVNMYCRYGIHSLLDRLESSLRSSHKWTEEDRKEIQEDLGKIISFCCAEPHQVWKRNAPPTKRKGEFTLRLLRLCTALRAREEGLALLKMLGTDFPSSKNEKSVRIFEGIQSEQVAQAIVDFECQITGNNYLQFL